MGQGVSSVNALSLLIILSLLSTTDCRDSVKPSVVVIPTPLTVGVDDLGWKKGWSDHDTGGPVRIGLPKGRWMVWEDYEAIVYVGKTLKTRLLCSFIMCEFDRSNICAEYPTTTQGANSWDNSALVNDDDFTIMNYIKDNAAYIEFGLHGVAHYYWKNGTYSRSEFADHNYGKGHKARPYSDMQGHMECFKRLIGQYSISFPKSFAAPHHCYYYNPSEPNDTGGLMNSWGVKYGILSRRTYLTDHGLMVIPRAHKVRWHEISTAPTEFVSDYHLIGHWPNFIELDPVKNHMAADKWIKWFNQIKDSPDRYLPKNTSQLFSQYLYKHYSNIKINGNTVTIDNIKMPDWAYEKELLGNLLLKLPLKTGTHVSRASLNDGNIACYYEERGFGYIILPKLDKYIYTLTFSISTSEMSNYVLNEGTYNVDRFEIVANSARVSVEMYGTQDVKVKLTSLKPIDVKSSNQSLIINLWKWEETTNTLVMNITATDAQGIKGDILISGESNNLSGPKHTLVSTSDSL